MQSIPSPIIFGLELLRKVTNKLGINRAPAALPCLPIQLKGQAASNHIEALLRSGKPMMAVRFGVGELNCTVRHAHLLHHRFNALDYLFKQGEAGWWTSNFKESMPLLNGFFPATEENMHRFGALMLQDMQQLDVLGCWQQAENYFAEELKGVTTVTLEDLEPYYHAQPWSKVLAGKKVLVVHPFAKSIARQYLQRENLFSNPDVLPEFTLHTLQAVQTLVHQTGGFNNWFDALAYMQQQIDAIDYEVAIIGCGAYGFPLAAHVKRQGKQAIHLGGATQMLFGVKGKRWEDIPFFAENIINTHWIRPSADETPQQAVQVENGCYW